jgi:hypothetical protein
MQLTCALAIPGLKEVSSVFCAIEQQSGLKNQYSAAE